MVARQLGAATRFPRWLSYKAYEHGRAMLAPTGVFRQSAQKGIVLPFHIIIMTQSALFCNSVEKSSKKFKKTIQMVGAEIVRFLYDEVDK